MNKKARKHNIKVYTGSVENAKSKGGFYVIGMLDESPLPKHQRYLIDLAQQKMNKNGSN
jgi:hypothetical protein